MISLALSNVTKYFDARPALQGVSWEIHDEEVIGLVGPNGSGKSVLFHTIIGEEEPTEGQSKLGPSIAVGYYAQEHETLRFDTTPVDEVRRMKSMSEGEAYGFLGSFLFDHQLAGKQIATLSGGEKSRLQMAKLTLMGANLLMLDEPTNNLDIPSAEVLEQALDDYVGTVFVISHDRYFLDRFVDRVVELDGGELSEFVGGYAHYREQKAAMREGA